MCIRDRCCREDICWYLVERVRRVTEGLIGEEQGAFRSGRGCVDQIFTLKQMIEKRQEKENKLYLGFMDLQQAYDRVNREALWQVLVIYGVGGRLLNGIKSMYAVSYTHLRAHETPEHLVCRLLLEKKKKNTK